MMDSEDFMYPAHKRKRADTDNKDSERFDSKSPLSYFPPFERLEDDRRLLASPTPVDTPVIDPTQSISERARESYLKQDSMALVLSPSSVECRQCKKKIKLSSKSAYDPFHWRNHRARCIKAHKRKVKATIRSKTPSSKKYLTPPMSLRVSLLDKGSPMHTPPLISDCEDDRVSDHFGERANSPTPSTSESFASSPKQEFPFTHSSLNTMFNDYLRRSHPDYAQPTTSFQQSAGRWRNWSWSQLEQPRFPVGDDNYDDNVDEDPLDRFEISSDIFRWTAAPSLPFIS